MHSRLPSPGDLMAALSHGIVPVKVLKDDDLKIYKPSPPLPSLLPFMASGPPPTSPPSHGGSRGLLPAAASRPGLQPGVQDTLQQRLQAIIEGSSLDHRKSVHDLPLHFDKYNVGHINSTELTDAIWKNFFQGKLTFTHWSKAGEAMAPIVSATGGTLLVRKLANLTPTQVFVGDVVLLKDPEKSDDLIVRRLAALEGYEMASSDEKDDEPFVLDKDQCWVLADNQSLKPKEARDSRLFGPVPMTDILGRVIYSLRTAVDHGPVENSRMAMNQDSPVLAVELDVEEMAKNNKM